MKMLKFIQECKELRFLTSIDLKKHMLVRKNILVLSAKRMKSKTFDTLHISLRQIRKSKGPKIGIDNLRGEYYRNISLTACLCASH